MVNTKSRKSDPLLDRTPPHDLDAEASLLSAIFITNDVLFDITDILAPEDFYKGAHKKIFRIILDLAAQEEPADLVTVANALKKKDELESIGGAAYLASIADAAPVAVNAVHYARIIQGKASLRAMIDAASKIIQHCLEDKGNVEDTIDFAESSIFQISEKKSGGSFRSLGELININIDKLEEQQGKDGGLSGLSTGYMRLNKITSGLQMTSEARIDSNRLRTGFISQEDWQNATDAAGILNEMPIFIDDTPNITVMDVRAKARKLYQKHGELGLIIIDYLQLMKAPFNSDRRDLEIAEISRGLKALAKELNIPVMALSQLNRMLEQRSDKRPMMSDLRESGALEQDADIIAFIYRDEVYNKEPDNPKKGTAEIIVAKNRNGAIGTAPMHFHDQYTRFEELAPDRYQEFQ
ncbi:MAG: replicative DNA helicase [Desulfobacteraceae bacterium]|nr:replicative DNA helicase [Desulfobacteraceae bacterium]